LTGLTVLDLSNNRLGCAGLRAVGHAPALRALQALELAGNPLGADLDESAPHELRGFLSSPLAGRLTRLGMAQTSLGRAGVEMLAVHRSLARLVDLDLSDNGIPDGPTIGTLAQSPVLASLRRLALRDNAVDVEGIVALAQSPQLENLEVLDLSGNALSPAALRALREAPRWWKLRKLRIGRQPATAPRMLGELRGRFGAALDLS
jgi:Ran GTPase-activating protein (RanGAP) involved in mRNA processing and transport